jgi:hypothetical protein
MCKPFKLTVKPETDFVALAAFVLAVGGVVFQAWYFFRGPCVTLFPTEQVLIFGEGNGPAKYVRFVGTMTYVNTGYVGYNAVVKREFLRFSVGGKQYEQEWQDFVSTTSTNDNESLEPQFQAPAHSVPVNAGSAESHETAFAPRTINAVPGASVTDKRANFLQWDQFLKELSQVHELDLEFVAEIYGQPTLRVKRSIQVDDSLIAHLRDKGWSAPSSWEVRS